MFVLSSLFENYFLVFEIPSANTIPEALFPDQEMKLIFSSFPYTIFPALNIKKARARLHGKCQDTESSGLARTTSLGGGGRGGRGSNTPTSAWNYMAGWAWKCPKVWGFP